MRITLEVDDTVAAISFTVIHLEGISTNITTTCLDVRNADGKIIRIPYEGAVTMKEASEDAGTD